MTQTPTHLLPTQHDSGWFDWPIGRIIWLGASISLALVMLIMPPIGLTLLGIGLIGAMPSGRYGYLYRMPEEVVRNLRFRRTAGLVFTRTLNDDAIDYDAGPKTTRRPLGLELQGLPVVGGNGEIRMLGVIHNPKTYQDSLITLARGCSRAASGDSFDKMFCDQQLSEVLKDVAGSSATNLELTQFFFSRRANPHATSRYIASRIHPDVLEPASETDRRLRDNLFEANDSVYADGRDPKVGFTLTATRPRRWRKLAISGLDAKESAQAPIMRLSAILSRGLSQSQIAGVERLGMLELNALIRAYLEPVAVDTLYDELAVDRARLEVDPSTPIDKMLTLSRGPWPSQIRTFGNHVILGGSYHRVLVCGRLAREQVPAGFFKKMLLIGDADYAVSVSATTYSLSKEMKRARNQRATAIAKARSYNRRGHALVVEPRDEEAMRRATDQHYLLYASGSRGVTYKIRVAVSGRSLDELDRLTTAIQDAFRRELIQLEPYEDSGVHLSAVMSMLGLSVG